MVFHFHFFRAHGKKPLFPLNPESSRSRSNPITSPLTEKFILPSCPLRKITLLLLLLSKKFWLYIAFRFGPFKRKSFKSGSRRSSPRGPPVKSDFNAIFQLIWKHICWQGDFASSLRPFLYFEIKHMLLDTQHTSTQPWLKPQEGRRTRIILGYS